MILEAVRRTDENAIRQHAIENAAMKMDETVETDRETSETDEKWQTISKQRQPWVPLDRRFWKIRKLAEFIHTSLPEQRTHELNQALRNMTLRNPLQVDHRHILKEEERERIFLRSNWNSNLNRNQWKSKSSTI